MRRLALIAALCLLPALAFAGQGMGPGPGIGAVVSAGSFNVSTFENTTDGWTKSYLGGVEDGFLLPDNNSPHAGSWSAVIGGGYLDPDYWDGNIWKTLNVVPGTMTFWVTSPSSDVKVTIGGTTVMDWTAVSGSYVQKTINVTQTGSLQVVIYSHYSVGEAIRIDDISIPVAE